MVRRKEVPPEFYDREYFVGGTKSGYGGTWQPYNGMTYHEDARVLARGIVEKSPYKSLLELGCASGILTGEFRKLGVDAWGIDISEWAVEQASPEVRPYLIRGDMCKVILSYEDNRFDITTAFDVLEHISYYRLLKLLPEICRVTKHMVLLRVPVVDNGVDKSHVTILSSNKWKSLFKTQRWKPWVAEEWRQKDGITSLRAVFIRSGKDYVA